MKKYNINSFECHLAVVDEISLILLLPKNDQMFSYFRCFYLHRNVSIFQWGLAFSLIVQIQLFESTLSLTLPVHALSPKLILQIVQ